MAVACVVDPLDSSTPIGLMVVGSGLEVFKSYKSRVQREERNLQSIFVSKVYGRILHREPQSGVVGLSGIGRLNNV